MPTTWYLYQLHVHGLAQARYVEERVKQLIRVQISALYYRIRALEQRLKALQGAVAEAKEIKKRTKALVRQGLITTTQLTEASLLLQTRLQQLKETQREKRSAESSLLQAMGLDPRAHIKLASSPMPEVPKLELVGLTYNALTKRPELFAADRQVRKARTEVYMALAKFLPVLNVAFSYKDTMDSLTVYPQSWQYAISGIISLLEGFERFHAVRGAQTNLEAAKQRRVELYLSIIAQVLQAHRAYKNAEEEERIAQGVYELAFKKLKESRALFREGLGTLAEVLSAERSFQEAIPKSRS